MFVTWEDNAKRIVQNIHAAPDADSADGLGAEAGRPKPAAAAVAVILALALAASLLGAYGWPAVVLAVAVGALAAGAIAALAARQLGGNTGDVLGAVQQAAETAMLLALSALLTP